MRIRAGTFFPGNSAAGESRVAVILRDRTYHHDPDTIALLTFRAATTELLCASRGSAPEHPHADQHTDAYDLTHRHRDLRSFDFGASDEGKERAIQVASPSPVKRAVPPHVRLVGGQQSIMHCATTITFM